MASFRFIGDFAMHHSILFDHLGQAIELEPIEAQKLALDGVSLIPAEDFKFTDEECEKHPNSVSREGASKEFNDKMSEALVTLYKFKNTKLEVKADA